MFLIPSSYYSVRETNQKGRGLFATRDIEPGKVIGDYLGKIVTIEDAVKTEPTGVYYMQLTKTHCALADKKIVGIHTINHSCAPNCGSDDYEGHVVYKTLRKIFKGEELTVDYFFGPPDRRACNPCRHICHCGTRFCRGTMHTPAHKHGDIQDDYTSTPQLFAKQISELLGKQLPQLNTYPDTLPDDPFFDLFGYEKQEPTMQNSSSMVELSTLRSIIRETGLTVEFPKLGIRVLGVADDVILSRRVR